MDENIGENISKNLCSKYDQKLIDHAKQSPAATNCFKKRFKKQQKQPVV